MNRYATDGLIRDAQLGKHVGFVSLRSEHAPLLAALSQSEGVVKVVRANGRQRVDYEGGGRIHLLSTEPAALRGFRFDVLYLDTPVETRHAGYCVDAVVAAAEVIRA